MEQQLLCSGTLQLQAVNSETQWVGSNETYGANTDTDNDTHIHGEMENNFKYETIDEKPQRVDDNSTNPTTTLDVVTQATTTCRYLKQHVVVHDDDSTSVGSGFTTPTSIIRECARLTTCSAGVCSNAWYSINYFQQKQSPASTYATACANPYTCNDFNQDRIFYFLQHGLPLGCLCCQNEGTKERLPNAPCELHKTIVCSMDRCEVTFHMGFMTEMKFINLKNLQGSSAN